MHPKTLKHPVPGTAQEGLHTQSFDNSSKPRLDRGSATCACCCPDRTLKAQSTKFEGSDQCYAGCRSNQYSPVQAGCGFNAKPETVGDDHAHRTLHSATSQPVD